MYKGLLTALLLTFCSTAAAAIQSICGPADDRTLSFEPEIGRLAVVGDNKGCTVTMISEDCGISAGHCLGALEQAEFNTPISSDGEPQPADARDTYLIDQESIVYQDEGPGKDWAVFKAQRNHITGRLPGEAQGFYEVGFHTPEKGSLLRVTGYGVDSAHADKNFAQQTHTGDLAEPSIFWRSKSVLGHTIDTMGGNSGSSIVEESSQKIIGIHTHGGCRANGGSNMGTLIAGHPELQEAIRSCLRR